MAVEFDDALFTLNLSGLKFDRTNEEKNSNVANKYAANMKHFFKNHKAIRTKVDLERFLIIKIGGFIFQGYADVVRKDKDGCFIIQDWKSSSIYKGAKIDKEKGQLVLYAEGLIQLGVPIEKIKICWNFLKYCNVMVEQANGKKSERQIERIKIGESLHSNVKMWLNKLGYSENMEYYLESLLQTNDINCLPKDVQKKYSFDDCYVYIPLDSKSIDVLNSEILDTIKEIKEKEKEYIATKSDKQFWDEDVESESFYFANLCSYGARLHLPYKKYLEEQKEKTDGSINAKAKTDSEDDLSWLNEI